MYIHVRACVHGGSDPVQKGKFSNSRRAGLTPCNLSWHIGCFREGGRLQLGGKFPQNETPRVCLKPAITVLSAPTQEVFSAVRDRYMRDGEGFLLVYSLTERATFTPMAKISDQIKRVKDTDQHIPIVLVGNKVRVLAGFHLANIFGEVARLNDDQGDGLAWETKGLLMATSHLVKYTLGRTITLKSIIQSLWCMGTAT